MSKFDLVQWLNDVIDVDREWAALKSKPFSDSCPVQIRLLLKTLSILITEYPGGSYGGLYGASIVSSAEHKRDVNKGDLLNMILFYVGEKPHVKTALAKVKKMRQRRNAAQEEFDTAWDQWGKVDELKNKHKEVTDKKTVYYFEEKQKEQELSDLNEKIAGLEKPTNKNECGTSQSSNHAPVIIAMVEPRSKDDWFLVIESVVKSFESKFKRTPTSGQLWNMLADCPPKKWIVAYNQKLKQLTMPSAKPMDREAFNKRYKRYYPDQ